MEKCEKQERFVTLLKKFRRARSEEHTSELQSRPHLVCRLLLEKKKHRRTGQRPAPPDRAPRGRAGRTRRRGDGGANAACAPALHRPEDHTAALRRQLVRLGRRV